MARPLRVDGSIVGPDGELSVLGEGDFAITADGEWTSPETGTTYPSGWTIAIPDHGAVDDGQAVTARSGAGHAGDDRRDLLGGGGGRRGNAPRQAVAGYGYIELTGYAPYEPLDLESSVGIGTPVP